MKTPETEHMRDTALGRVQAASALHREAGTILTDAMRAYRKTGGSEATLVIESGLKLSVVRAIVAGKRAA
jgi:hypothetical protein